MGFIQPGKSVKKRKIKKSINIEPIKYVQPKKSILERLPHELLFKIFIQTGLKGNNLPLANKGLRVLLSLSHRPIDDSYWPGRSLILEIIEIHFKHNLNQNIDLLKIRNKLRFYRSKLPNNESNIHITELNEGLTTFEAVPFVLDASLFTYKFVSPEILDLLRSQACYALDYSVITEEITERPRFVKDHLKALSKECKSLNINDRLPEDECDSMARVANELFNMNSENQVNHDTNGSDIVVQDDKKYSFSIFSKLPKFPNKFVKEDISLKTLKTMVKMHEFGFYIEDKDSFAVNVIRSFDKNDFEMTHWQDSFSLLLELTGSILSSYPVIEAFEMLLNCKPVNKEIYYTITNQVLKVFYYRVRNTEGLDDTNLWHYIMNTKNYDFVNMVMHFSGSPSNDILALMNT